MCNRMPSGQDRTNEDCFCTEGFVLSNREQNPGPLAGVRVLNAGTAIVGPWAATLLGYLGADVIKVERPTGETTRMAYPRQQGWATGYIATNVNQRSVALDTKNPEHQAILDRLADQADVLVENYRPGVADRMGIGYARLSERNPGLIYVSSSGWGDSGPMRNMAAVDPHLQAFSGFAALNGVPGGEPEMLRYTHIDPSGATYMAGIALLGLIGRVRYGAGSHLRTSHLAMALTMESSRAAECLADGLPIQRLASAATASAPNQCFRARDGKIIAVVAETPAQWQALCDVVGLSILRDDVRFSTNRDRVVNRAALADILATEIAKYPSRWWTVAFERHGVPFGYSLDFDQIANHRQIEANQLLAMIEPHHTGPMYVGGLPWRFSRTPASISPEVPAPGADTAAIASEGFTPRAENPFTVPDEANSRMPLSGIRVIDATQGYAGPLIGLLLAEAGAEVIKVESPEGDWSRHLSPATADGASSALFDAFNRNKLGQVLDLKDTLGRERFTSLVDSADVVLEDWGPGRAKAQGIDPELRISQNRRLVWLSLSAYGEEGPMAQSPGSELTIQAMTGYLRTLGHLNGDPERVGADIAGSAAAGMGFIAVLAALFERFRSGMGQRVAVSLLGSLMAQRTLQWAAMTRPDAWLGNSYCTSETDTPRHGYRTKDHNIFVSMMNLRDQSQFITLIKELGMYDEVQSDPRFMEDGRQTVGMGHLARDLQAVWEKYLKQIPSQEAIAIFNRNGATAVEFSELRDLLYHPQVQSLQIVETGPSGKRYLRAPWQASWGLPRLSAPLAPTAQHSSADRVTENA